MGFDELELSERLLIARRGTAYLAQRLSELTDDELSGDTLFRGGRDAICSRTSGTTPRRCAD